MKRLIVEQEGPVWVVRFHNPPHQDMDHVTAEELSELLDAVEASSELRAVIFTGSEEGVFIRHYDVGELLQAGTAMADKDLRFSEARPVPETEVHRCLRRIESLPVIFIAAVNGSAMGGGFELALSCDLRLVQEGEFDLGLPEINIGLLPGAGGTQRLSRLLGQARAMEMILLGNTISPQRAFELGLALECVDGNVLQRAREVAAQIVGNSSLATTHIKNLIRGASDWSVEEGLAIERTLFCDLMVGQEGLQKMREFIEGSGDIRSKGR
jgi:enoyl-CoA hydratase/carnithine racemase